MTRAPSLPDAPRRKRKNFSKATLAERFFHAEGRCEWIEPTTGVRCNAVLVPGRWHGDHDIPDALGGETTFGNCRCLCLHHHAIKTGQQDVPAIAKAKRREIAAIRPRNDAPKAKIPTAAKPAPKVRRFDRTPLPPRQMFVKGPEA